MKKYITVIVFFSLLLTACSSDDDSGEGIADNEKIELSVQVTGFTRGTLRASADDGSAAEQAIENLYVFLFPTSGTQTFKDRKRVV